MSSTRTMAAPWRAPRLCPAGARVPPAANAGCARLVDAARPAPAPGGGAPGDPPLAALIARMSLRDDTALAALYDATAARVYSLAVRILRDAGTAEEVVVDTFHQAWRDARRFDAARGAPLAWLLVICRSRALDALRARDPAVCTDDPEALRGTDDTHTVTDPLDCVAVREETAALHAALAALAPAQRQMLGLAFFRGATHEEIAAHGGLPLGTVKSQIRRALAALKRALDPPGVSS